MITLELILPKTSRQPRLQIVVKCDDCGRECAGYHEAICCWGNEKGNGVGKWKILCTHECANREHNRRELSSAVFPETMRVMGLEKFKGELSSAVFPETMKVKGLEKFLEGR